MQMSIAGQENSPLLGETYLQNRITRIGNFWIFVTFIDFFHVRLVVFLDDDVEQWHGKSEQMGEALERCKQLLTERRKCRKR
jgi:hypothetical protein